MLFMQTKIFLFLFHIKRFPPLIFWKALPVKHMHKLLIASYKTESLILGQLGLLSLIGLLYIGINEHQLKFLNVSLLGVSSLIMMGVKDIESRLDKLIDAGTITNVNSLSLRSYSLRLLNKTGQMVSHETIWEPICYPAVLVFGINSQYFRLSAKAKLRRKIRRQKKLIHDYSQWTAYEHMCSLLSYLLIILPTAKTC